MRTSTYGKLLGKLGYRIPEKLGQEGCIGLGFTPLELVAECPLGSRILGAYDTNTLLFLRLDHSLECGGAILKATK